MRSHPDAERDVDQHNSATRTGALPIHSQSGGPTKNVPNIPTIPIRADQLTNAQIQGEAERTYAAQTKYSERQILHLPPSVN